MSHDSALLDSPEPGGERRRKTPYDWTMAIGSLAGAIVAIGVATSYVADLFPYVKREAYLQRLAQVDQNLAELKQGFVDVQRVQRQTLELQLQDKRWRLQDRLAGAAQGSQEQRDLRQDLAETEQRLDAVKEGRP